MDTLNTILEEQGEVVEACGLFVDIEKGGLPSHHLIWSPDLIT